MIRRILGSALLVLFVATGAYAQVATRFFVVPKTGTGSLEDTIRPKYVMELGAMDWQAVNYGRDDAYLVGAVLTPAQVSALASNIDAIVIPAQLDNAIGLSGVSAVQSALEGLHVPAQWVTQTHTYRQVVGAVGRMFFLMQTFGGMTGYALFQQAGITLDTRINQLTQQQRSDLLAAASAKGLDTSGVTGPMTLRQALRLLAEQIQPFTVMGETF